MLNRLKVIICGKEYMLQTEEPPSCDGYSVVFERMNKSEGEKSDAE